MRSPWPSRGTSSAAWATSWWTGSPGCSRVSPTGSPAPIGILGDLLAAAINPNVGAFILSPMATEMEAQAVRWIAELMGYPASAGGLLVSGGDVAKFVGFLAARRAIGGPAIRARGLGEAGPPLRVYASRAVLRGGEDDRDSDPTRRGTHHGCLAPGQAGSAAGSRSS